MSILGSIIGGIGSIIGAKMEMKQQERFAKKGIRWRVKDAKLAGVHPLFALGAQTTSYSPVGLGSTLADLGQDLGSSVQQTLSAPERSSSFTAKAQKLTLQRLGLENLAIASEIQRAHQPGAAPAAPGGATMIAGQPQSGPSVEVTLPGGSKVSVPTSNYEQLERQVGEPADLYGAMHMGGAVMSSDKNWEAVKSSLSHLNALLDKRIRQEGRDAWNKPWFYKRKPGVYLFGKKYY